MMMADTPNLSKDLTVKERCSGLPPVSPSKTIGFAGIYSPNGFQDNPQTYVQKKYDFNTKPSAKIVWLGVTPISENFTKSKNKALF
jgi:hypothetical protein